MPEYQLISHIIDGEEANKSFEEKLSEMEERGWMLVEIIQSGEKVVRTLHKALREGIKQDTPRQEARSFSFGRFL